MQFLPTFSVFPYFPNSFSMFSTAKMTKTVCPSGVKLGVPVEKSWSTSADISAPDKYSPTGMAARRARVRAMRWRMPSAASLFPSKVSWRISCKSSEASKPSVPAGVPSTEKSPPPRDDTSKPTLCKSCIIFSKATASEGGKVRRWGKSSRCVTEGLSANRAIKRS